MDRADVQINIIEPEQQTEFFKVYEKVFSSRKEVETFYGRFIENGWISGAWKNGELIGILSWTPREAVKHGLAEIIDFWVKVEERKKGDIMINFNIEDHRRYKAKLKEAINKAMKPTTGNPLTLEEAYDKVLESLNTPFITDWRYMAKTNKENK